MAAAVVDVADLALRRTVLLEHAAGRPIERLRKDLGAGFTGLRREQLEGGCQRQKLAERVPA